MPNLNIRHLQLFFKQITKEAETPTKTGGTTRKRVVCRQLFFTPPPPFPNFKGELPDCNPTILLSYLQVQRPLQPMQRPPRYYSILAFIASTI